MTSNPYSSVPTDPAVRPRAVDAAFWLYVAGAVIGLIGAVVNVVLLPASIDATRAATERLGGSTSAATENAIAIGAVVGVVLSAVLTLAYSIVLLVFAPRMRRGRNWARIALAVIAGVQILGVLGSDGVGAVHFVVLLIALILTFVPTSNAWFRAVGAQRATV